jgi:hypothetical protein
MWFFGRGEISNRLSTVLAQGQHAGVFGLRKIGKTSLLNQIQQRFEGTPTALVDCQAHGYSSNAYLEDILCQLTKELAALGVRGSPLFSTHSRIV